jgi:hypothetical protein
MDEKKPFKKKQQLSGKIDNQKKIKDELNPIKTTHSTHRKDPKDDAPTIRNRTGASGGVLQTSR